jgi:hypothetical protein
MQFLKQTNQEKKRIRQAGKSSKENGRFEGINLVERKKKISQVLLMQLQRTLSLTLRK